MRGHSQQSFEQVPNVSDVVDIIVTFSGGSSDGVLISDSDVAISQWIMFTIVCLSIDVFGTVTNIINIICFVNQGFNDPVNVSLMGLAISDIGCLVPLTVTCLGLTPGIINADLPFEPFETQSLIASWPHVTFTRISAWLTALITLERCLCVTAPLQVKSVITPKRVTIIITCLFILLIASMTPVYVVKKLGMKFFPTRNRTLLGLIVADNNDDVETISFTVNNAIIPGSAFVVIIVCTTILVIKLKSNTKWRSKSTATQTDKVTRRNDRASKMVVMISGVFIACFIPSVFVFVASVTEKEMSMAGKHRNICIVLFGLGFVLESVNSSMNIFIYYRMSSRYRDTFDHLFGFSKARKH